MNGNIRPLRGRIKVGYLIDYYYADRGGTERQLIELVRRLDKSRFEPFLICLHSTEWIRSNTFPCKCVCLGYSGLVKPSIVGVIARLRYLIENERFDVVQTWFWESVVVLFLSTLFMRKCPSLLSSRRDIGMIGQPWYHRVYSLVLPLVDLRYDLIVANSEIVRRHVIRSECVSAGKVKVIGNGVDGEIGPAEKPDLFVAAGAAVWIAVVANLSPVKRIDVFLRAFSEAKKSVRDIRVKAIILGEGPERAHVEALRRDLHIEEDVHFLGSKPDVTSYLQYVDIAVLCSDREGQSNAILEYMVHSLPIVATAVGGNTELVDDANGACIPPGDPVLLAAALRTLILNPEMRREKGRRSRERVVGLFSWKSTVDQWQSLYESLVHQREARTG